MRKETALLALLALGLAGHAAALVSVSVADGSASLAEVAPAPGSAAVARSTSDPVRFTSEGSTEGELILLSAAHSFTWDRDGSTSTTTVAHQGTTTALADNLHVAQSPTGAFLPLRLVGADLTGEAGWTPASGCGTVTYQGSLSVPWYSNAGVAQAALVRYYQVCDSGAKLYLDTDKSLNAGADLAYVSTHQRVFPEEADYEVAVQGADFAFASAASAATVTLQQGRFVPSALTSGATNVDSYFLYRFPDGFPAGVTTTTLTATATDVTV